VPAFTFNSGLHDNVDANFSNEALSKVYFLVMVIFSKSFSNFSALDSKKSLMILLSLSSINN